MKKNELNGLPIRGNLRKALRIMKLTTVLLLVFVFQTFAVVGYAQRTQLTLDMKNISVEDALYEIEQQSDYVFLYNRDLIDVSRKSNLKVKNAKIETVLEQLFEGSGVGYQVIDRQVVLSIKDVQQQKRTVSGKVTDLSGQPLPGVTVLIKGTTQGTISDFEGNYIIDNVPVDGILVFSFVGMLTQEVLVGDQTTIDVSMHADAIGLEEVVAVGYGTQRKVNLTGSITSVKTAELQNIPAANLSNTLAGRAPGVQIVGNSGLAGATATIRIRGSFKEPLYVIDGVVSDKSAFDALDANEVESINFMKDAASSAIYGSQAGNGVVIITTKGGIKQEPRFNYKASFSTSRPTSDVQSYTAAEEIAYVNNMMVTRGQEKPYGQDIIDYFKDKSYDINDLIWQDPSVQQHNLSVNGGTEKMTYYLALGYHTEDGSYHNTNYDRYNFRSNVTAQISDAFKVNVNISGNQRNYDRWYWPYDGADDFKVGDWYRATFNWTRLYPFYVDAQGNPTNNPNDIPIKTAGGYHPPEIMLNGGSRETVHRSFDGIIKFDLDLDKYVKGLSTSLQGHINSYDMNMKSFVKHNKWYIFQPANATNKFIPGPVDFTKTGAHTLSSGYENINENVSLTSSYQINWFVNYERAFGEHNLSALAVYEQSGYKGKGLYGRADQLLSSNIDQIFNASRDAERRWFDGDESESASSSLIGRVNYSYASKYILEFSFRYDGNYRFAPSGRFGFFPSFSGGWRLSEENFLSDIDWLSNLKLRGSWGSTGSLETYNGGTIGPWQWTNTYSKSGSYVFGNSLVDGLRPGTTPNPDITWASTDLWDIGMEFGLFNSKLSGEFSIWGKKTKDILGPRSGSTPTTLGANLPWLNYAGRSWKGFEMSASYKNRKGELKYEVYGNMGYAIDEWDTYDEPDSYTDGTYKDNWRSRIGKPANRVFGLISNGMIRTEADLAKLPAGYTVYGREPQIGTLWFEDIRGQNYSDGPDGKIDDNDRVYLSDNGAPRINYGFGVNLEWKGFSVNTHFQGVGAFDRMVSNRNGDGVFQVDRPYFELWASNYWTPETPNAKYPRVAGEWRRPEYGGTGSSFWVRNGAYLRLKNLNIGYALPKHWYNKLGIDNVQVFANGTNLFVLTDFKEYDPEQATLDSYPLMKTFTGGVNINF